MSADSERLKSLSQDLLQMSFRASAGPPPSPSSILKTATANATTAAKANLPYPQPSSTRSHSSAQLSNSFTGFTKHTTPATPAHASFSATLDTSTASPTVAGAASPTTRFAPASSYSSASSPYRLANQRQHQVIRSFSPYARPAASLSPISFQTSSMLFDFLRDELGHAYRDDPLTDTCAFIEKLNGERLEAKHNVLQLRALQDEVQRNAMQTVTVVTQLNEEQRKIEECTVRLLHTEAERDQFKTLLEQTRLKTLAELKRVSQLEHQIKKERMEREETETGLRYNLEIAKSQLETVSHDDSSALRTLELQVQTMKEQEEEREKKNAMLTREVLRHQEGTNTLKLKHGEVVKKYQTMVSQRDGEIGSLREKMRDSDSALLRLKTQNEDLEDQHETLMIDANSAHRQELINVRSVHQQELGERTEKEIAQDKTIADLQQRVTQLQTLLESERDGEVSEQSQVAELQSALNKANEEGDNQKTELGSLRAKLEKEREEKEYQTTRLKLLQSSLEKEREDKEYQITRLQLVQSSLDREKEEREFQKTRIEELHSTLAMERGGQTNDKARFQQLQSTLERERKERENQRIKMAELEATVEKEKEDRMYRETRFKLLQSTLEKEREERSTQESHRQKSSNIANSSGNNDSNISVDRSSSRNSNSEAIKKEADDQMSQTLKHLVNMIENEREERQRSNSHVAQLLQRMDRLEGESGTNQIDRSDHHDQNQNKSDTHHPDDRTNSSPEKKNTDSTPEVKNVSSTSQESSKINLDAIKNATQETDAQSESDEDEDWDEDWDEDDEGSHSVLMAEEDIERELKILAEREKERRLKMQALRGL